MSLYGIDIASYQSSLDISKVACDFVIVKATEGTGYINPVCDKHFQQALKLGKKLGFYHYAQNEHNTARQEADFFINNCLGYFGKGIPVLDWEEGVHDVAWALEWLKIVEERTGVKPLIYMSESVANKYDWSKVVANNNGLWVAKYRDYEPDYNYDMSSAGTVPSTNYWSFYAIWQFTSSGRLNGYNGNLDCNIFYGDEKAWDKYVSVYKESKPTPPQHTFKYNVGQKVRFSTCYISSSNAVECKSPIQAKDMVRDNGTITHRYNINGTSAYLLDNGLCFVNDGDIRGLYNEPAKPVDNWVSRLDAECKKQGFNGYPTVKKGAKGNITKLIQERLNSVGFNLNVDGSFGNDTEYAVKVFQRNRNLSNDGVVGANTWRYLVDGKSY